MEKGNYHDDYKLALDVINKDVSGFFKTIFYCSNEDLKSLFKNFNFKDKYVLCVAASSDQYFHCLEHGASDIDLFDINNLTKYYVYLRRWIIKYCGTYYPDYNKLIDSKDFLKKLLLRVNVCSKEEQDVYEFWKLFSLSSCSLENLFVKPKVRNKNEIINLNELSKVLDISNFDFINFDLSDEAYILNKKYDVVIISNILEHFGLDDMKINNIKDNLRNLLNDDGIVICSYVYTTDFDSPRVRERELFDDEFNCSQIFETYNGHDMPIGYVYTKKNIKKM